MRGAADREAAGDSRDQTSDGGRCVSRSENKPRVFWRNIFAFTLAANVKIRREGTE